MTVNHTNPETSECKCHFAARMLFANPCATKFPGAGGLQIAQRSLAQPVRPIHPQALRCIGTDYYVVPVSGRDFHPGFCHPGHAEEHRTPAGPHNLTLFRRSFQPLASPLPATPATVTNRIRVHLA